jgi:hypothetical protein
MNHSTQPQINALNLEIKLPYEDTPHYVQLLSTSTVSALKVKIFRKAPNLEGEKPESYCLAVKHKGKTDILAEDKKLVQSHQYIEDEFHQDRLVVLYLLPKEKNIEPAKAKRRKDSSGNVRMSIYDENKFLLRGGHSGPVLLKDALTPQGYQFLAREPLGRNISTVQLYPNPVPHPSSTPTSPADGNNKRLFRSKSEPCMRSGTSLSHSDTTITESESDILSSHDDMDSLSTEEEDDLNSTTPPESPVTRSRGRCRGDSDSKSKRNERNEKDKNKNKISKVKEKEKEKVVEKPKQKKKLSTSSNLNLAEKEVPTKESKHKSNNKETTEPSTKDKSRKKGSLLYILRRDKEVPTNNGTTVTASVGATSTATTHSNNNGSPVASLPHSNTSAVITSTIGDRKEDPNKKRHSLSMKHGDDKEPSHPPQNNPDPQPANQRRSSPPATLIAPVDYSGKKSNPGLMVEEDPSGEKLIVTAGTVDELIYCLADRDIPDPVYLDEFFYTMAYFTTGSTLMDRLRTRFDYYPPSGNMNLIADYNKWRLIIQQRVLNVMRYWMENHWYHFERDKSLLPLMKQFVELPSVRNNPRSKPLKDLLALRETPPSTPTTSSPTPYAPTTPPHGVTAAAAASATKRISTGYGAIPPLGLGEREISVADLSLFSRTPSAISITWRNRRDTDPGTTTVGDDPVQHSIPTSLTTVVPVATTPPPPKSLGKKFKDYRKVSFMRVHPIEIARQMTLIEAEMFRSICPPELVGGSWKKKNRVELSPNVVRMIDWFNRITAWIQTEVVMTPNLRERALVLGRFIQVAEHCKAIGNFNTAMEVLSALNTVCVKRLNKTWRSLTRKEELSFAELEDVFSNVNNYVNYRRLIHDAASREGVLPYIGVVLQDLLMIEELPTLLPNGMVNFRKMRRFTGVLRSEILERQARSLRFNFMPLPVVQEFLIFGIQTLSEADLYKYSRLCEPSSMV